MVMTTGEEKPIVLTKPETTTSTQPVVSEETPVQRYKRISSTVEKKVEQPAPVVYTTPIMQQALEQHPEAKEKIEEKLVVVPVSKPTTQPVSPVYQQVLHNRAIQLGEIQSNIRMVESTPEGTMFTTESGETISREEALRILGEQKTSMIGQQQQIVGYQQKGYVVSRDEQGDLVFSKPVQPTQITTSEQYSPSGWGFLSFLTSGFTPTFGLSGPTSPEENIKNLQDQLMFTEQRRAEMVSRGDYLGLGWEVITSPIPMTFITAGLGFISEAFAQTSFGSKVFGQVTLPKILGSKTISATPSTTMSLSVGSVFIGAGAGSITRTFNEFGMDAAKQSLLVSAVMLPVYATAFKAGRNIYRNLPREWVGRSYEFSSKPGYKLEVVGQQKYVDIMGKKIFMGRLESTVGRIIKSPVWESGPPSWKPYTGIQPTSIFVVKPLGEPMVVPISFKGKTFVSTGMDVGWQPVVKSSLMVKPSSGIVPYKPFVPVIRVVEWQPQVGLKVHPSEIKSLDELFKVYREGKITTDEYQTFREQIKPVEDIGKPIHPLGKPPVKITPKPYSPPPIKMDITKEGVISTSWYGKKSISTDKGWQPLITKQKGLSTTVYPKPKVYRAYETYYRFFVFEPKPTITIKPKMVSTKPFQKGITIKDVVKSDKEISKEFGGGGQVQRGGTVTVQKTETIVEPVVEQINKLFVPEELQKPVTRYGTYGIQIPETGPKNIFQELITPTKTTTTRTSINLLFPNLGVRHGTIQEINIGQQTSSVSLSLMGNIQISQQRNINVSGVFQDSLHDVVYDTVYKKIGKTIGFEPRIMETVTPTKITSEETISTSKKPRFGFDKDVIDQQSLGTPVYHVLVKPRQYVDGKRISKGTPYRITKKPLSYFDALALGSHKIDNTSKATFILEQTSGKPGKIPKNIKPWSSQMLEYNQKEGNRFIELNRFRIDSPGEIREISMRGWNSHKNKRRSRRR